MSWQPPLEKHYNGSITGYIIQYGRVGSDDKRSMNVPNDTKHTISGLFAYVEYSVTVAAVNANGTGPFSKPVVATSGEDSELNYTTVCLITYIANCILTLIYMHSKIYCIA